MFDDCFVFLSLRVPMYSEAKLAFFIYLWYPKTRVSVYIWMEEKHESFYGLHDSLSMIV
jgi:hypothetical protein